MRPEVGDNAAATGAAAAAAAAVTCVRAAALQDHLARALRLDAQLARGLRGARPPPRARAASTVAAKAGRASRRAGHGGKGGVRGGSGLAGGQQEPDELERLLLAGAGQRAARGGAARGARALAGVEESRESSTRRGAEDDEERSVLRAELSRAWTCEECTLLNASGPSHCAACGSSRRAQLAKLARAESERSAPRTLAQRLGLLPAPPAPLSERQWSQLEGQSEARKDSYEPCAICRQPFGTEEQLLLSCSHVFHTQCLLSFERFVRSSERCCPLCRKSDYEKRAVRLGAKAHSEMAATKAQAWWRATRQRASFRRLLSDFYASGAGDERRRHAFFAGKLRAVGDKLQRAVAAQEDSLDRLFRDLDASLQESRRVFGAGAGPVSEQDWAAVLERVLAREGHECECAICMSAIPLAGRRVAHDEPGCAEDLNAAARAASAPEARRATLLSCSHVFHAACIAAFERFAIGQAPRCPMCRDAYRATASLS
jgi:hypothetical protein